MQWLLTTKPSQRSSRRNSGSRSTSPARRMSGSLSLVSRPSSRRQVPTHRLSRANQEPRAAREAFTCGSGYDSFDSALVLASANDNDGGTETYCSVHIESGDISGFFSLFVDLQQRYAEAIPGSYPRGVAHLAYIGVHESLQGSGLGTALLVHAMKVVCDHRIQFTDISLEPLDERLRAWYASWGFENLPSGKMYLPVEDARVTVADPDVTAAVSSFFV